MLATEGESYDKQINNVARLQKDKTMKKIVTIMMMMMMVIEVASANISFDEIPDMVVSKKQTWYLGYQEQQRMADILSVVAVGETGLNNKFNNKGWDIELGGRNHMLSHKTINQILHRRGYKAYGMFQCRKTLLRDAIKAGVIKGSDIFSKETQLKVITWRMLSMRKLGNYLKGKTPLKTVMKPIAMEFESMPLAKKGKKGYYGKVHMSYASFKQRIKTMKQARAELQRQYYASKTYVKEYLATNTCEKEYFFKTQTLFA